MIKIWTNTKTLDGYIDDLEFTNKKTEATAALIGGKTIDPDEFPNLKLIFRTGVSKDNLPFEKAKKRNIKVEIPSDSVQDFIFRETADFTSFLILKMMYLNVGTIDPWVKFGRTALSKKTLLVLGTGRIGRMVANKMKNFMNVLTYDVMTNTPDELDDFIGKSDCISIHIPNTPDNKGFLNHSKMKLMKKDSILINTARGAIVDENDLFEYLQQEKIYAAFDVYWQEPYQGKLKAFLDNRFYMTPHIASTCDQFLEGAALDFRKLLGEI